MINPFLLNPPKTTMMIKMLSVKPFAYFLFICQNFGWQTSYAESYVLGGQLNFLGMVQALSIISILYFWLHVLSGDVSNLYSSNNPIGTKAPSVFLNDLDIASDGTIYLTDSSLRWGRRHNRFLVMEGRGAGRWVTLEMDLILMYMYFYFTHFLLAYITAVNGLLILCLAHTMNAFIRSLSGLGGCYGGKFPACSHKTLRTKMLIF